MLFMTNLYASSLLLLLENEIQPSTTAAVAAPLSRTEHLRILRAFYRLQINVNVFGDRETRDKRQIYRADTWIMNYYLFGLWQPWEFQEMKCVLSYYNLLLPRLAEFTSADTDLGFFLLEEAFSAPSYYNFATFRHVLDKMRVQPENNLDQVLRSAAKLKRRNMRLADQVYHYYDMWWLRSKHVVASFQAPRLSHG